MNGIEWELIRTFLAVTEQGSVSGAARVLGASQPTLSRHIRELDRRTQLSLFERSPRGLGLTGQGEALMRAGAGIGATHAGLAARYPELVRVLPGVPLPALEFWCVCHRDLRLNPRVRALMRFAGEWFGDDPYR